jgi:transmembrane sensor
VAATASIAAFFLSPIPRTGIGAVAWREGAVTYETGVGTVKDVHLDDGSNITLSGQTKLLVTYTKRVRSVRLIQGEAWFKVAHDLQWPFIVQAGKGDIRAVGTAFLVTRDSDRVVVTVTEGTVTVTATPPPAKKHSPGAAVVRVPVRVTRGEEVSYRDNGTMASTVTADARAATAWTRGRLVFDNEPLRYVVESVNRYFPGHISVSPSAGQLRFSGVIFDRDIQDWLDGLSEAFPVIVSDHGASICVRMRGAEPDASCDAAP